jgi:hypothetical protein
MEEVLELYHRPLDPKRPLVCFDESSKQLVSETRVPIPPEPNKPERYDCEYKREGVCNLFMFFAPLLAWRHVSVTDRRTQTDFALQMKYLVDEAFPEAEKVVVVMDNLNTHVAHALYKQFAPAEARRILERLEFHYTPKHGSWLNRAEIEFSVLANQCLDQRIAHKPLLTSEIAAWETRRNQSNKTVDWQFSTSDARIKLKRLYPSLDD